MILGIPPFHDAGNTVRGLSQAASPCNVLSKWKAVEIWTLCGGRKSKIRPKSAARQTQWCRRIRNRTCGGTIPIGSSVHQFIARICPLGSCQYLQQQQPNSYASAASMSASSSGATWGTVMCAAPVTSCAALKSPTTSIACGLRAHERRATPLITSHSIAD